MTRTDLCTDMYAVVLAIFCFFASSWGKHSAFHVFKAFLGFSLAVNAGLEHAMAPWGFRCSSSGQKSRFHSETALAFRSISDLVDFGIAFWASMSSNRSVNEE